jgi:hypothetical protein
MADSALRKATLLWVARSAWLMGGVSGVALAQAGRLVAGYDDATLGFAAGSTVVFEVDGYQIGVTPLSVPSASGGDLGSVKK